MFTIDLSLNQLSWQVQSPVASLADRSGHVVEGLKLGSGISSKTGASQTQANETSKKTYIVVLDSVAETVSSCAQSALQQAGIESKPTKIFEAVKTFTADLTQDEAERLKNQPNVKSVEEDRSMPMTPPVEVNPLGWGAIKPHGMHYKDQHLPLGPPADNNENHNVNLNLVTEQEVMK